eukprot:1344867-Pyramimonas_sp.AAC.1
MEIREVVPTMMRVFPNLHMTERRPSPFDRSRRTITFNRPGTQLLKKKVIRKFKEAHVTEDLDGLSQLDEGELEALNAELGSFDGDADDETVDE